MPLLEIRHLPGSASLAIWKIEETNEFFLNLVDLTAEELGCIRDLKGRRKTEWLASRWLWNVLAKDLNHGPIVKDDHGKPHILGSTWQMSISHTHAYTAVIAAPLLVGIDIQIRVEKITRLTTKFLSEGEMEQVKLSSNPLEHLHVYWCAKESLYKAYGRKKLDFKNHLLISPFNLERGMTRGFVKKEGNKEFKIHFELTKAFVLVYAIEKI